MYSDQELIDMVQFAFDRFFGSKTTDQAVRNCIRDFLEEKRK